MSLETFSISLHIRREMTFIYSNESRIRKFIAVSQLRKKSWMIFFCFVSLDCIPNLNSSFIKFLFVPNFLHCDDGDKSHLGLYFFALFYQIIFFYGIFAFESPSKKLIHCHQCWVLHFLFKDISFMLKDAFQLF